MDRILSLLTSIIPGDLTPGYVREFHDAVREAIADGKLTEAEIEAIERRKEELGLPDTVLDAVRLELYMQAYGRVTEDARISEDEWDELQQIQDYLGLKDAEIGQTKRELYRLRILSEIRNGNLPVVDPGTVRIESGEVLHWKEPVREWRASRSGETNQTGTVFNKTGWEKEGSATFFLTSRRIGLTGKDADAWTYRRILSAKPYANGSLLAVNREPVRFLEYEESGNRNIVGSVLTALLEQTTADKRLSED